MRFLHLTLFLKLKQEIIENNIIKIKDQCKCSHRE